MDQRPVSAPGRNGPPSWKLAPPHDKLTQGMVVSGFATLPTGRALFLEFGWDGVKREEGGAWLEALQQVAPITDADGRDPRAAGIGFTWQGLRKMGLNANSLASFDRPFKEGMFQEDRLRRLGDRRGEEWLKTVIEGGPKWSGNIPLDAAARDPRAHAFADDGPETPEQNITTPITVHALLLLYEKDEETAEAWCAEVSKALAPHQVTVVHRLPLQLRPDERGIAREHFGFADGVSQPMPYEAGVVTLGASGEAPQDPWNGVPLGEILMGHTTAHHEIAPGPVVPDGEAAQKAGLPPHPRGEGFRDLGLDGSYMVVRELKQDVAAFWNSMADAAKRISEGDPEHSGHIDSDWLADRVVGRDKDGNLLCPGGVLPPNAYDQPDNDFAFYDRDPHGHGCPLGSHVRRGNPRDGLAPKPADKQTLLEAANSHRILRRGRKYGPTIADPMQDDGADRGLLFICLNTDITRQFEFVQQTWVLNPNFATLFDEVDPLIGPKGTLTIPEDPLRRIIGVDTFVQMAGGEYFFLPSMPALRYLASL
ncbi:Dyp-type peroxidase [Sphingomonas sp. DT-207]|uniref:Dyp-type peroxidase n=1 Tax=Sphingomonas sp. DT-207 TaxID=3396167 RepID=UPI003F1B165E